MNLHIREQSRRSSDLHVCTPVGPNQEQKFEPGVCLQMDVLHLRSLLSTNFHNATYSYQSSAASTLSMLVAECSELLLYLLIMLSEPVA